MSAIPPQLAPLRRASKQRIVVIGDIHGCCDSLARELQLAGLVDAYLRWQGGAADRLVICGDMVDEGAASRDVLHLVRRLQNESDGHVIALLGNHELRLLRALTGDATPLGWETVWSWAVVEPALQAFLSHNAVPRLTTERIRQAFQESFLSAGNAVYPPDYVAACAAIPGDVTQEAVRLLRRAMERDGTLAWLAHLPVAASIGSWGFFHGGPPSGFAGGIPALNRSVTALLQAGEWQHPLLELYHTKESAVAARGWMNSGEAAVDALFAPFGIKQVAFGHSPGSVNGIFGKLDHRWGKAFKADTYCSLGIEGFLEVLDKSVWAVYTDIGRDAYRRVHPDIQPLPAAEMLWSV